MKPFGHTGEQGTCLWCGDKLRHKYDTKWAYTGKVVPRESECFSCGHTKFVEADDAGPNGIYPFRCAKCGHEMTGRKVKKVVSRTRKTSKPGYYGTGHFCSLNCGFQFGLWHAEKGYRLRLEKKKEKEAANG